MRQNLAPAAVGATGRSPLRYAERGITFLFSTHDPNVMARARRLIQLHDGSIARDEKKSSA